MKLVIVHNLKQVLMNTDVKLAASQWDAVKQRVVNHPQRLILNEHLSNIRNLADSIILQLLQENLLEVTTAAEIKELILCELDPARVRPEINKYSFLYRYNTYMERTVRGTRRTFEYTLDRLKAYIGEERLEKLSFEDINYSWLKGFDNFLANAGNSVNTRNIHYRNMRAVFNEALEDNVTTAYPFRRFKIKNEVTAKRNLTVEELRQLFFYQCEEHAVKYRDYFMLMFFLMGINNVDFCYIKQIVKGRIEFHRTKTRHFFSMKVEPEALELIEKYRGEKWLLKIMDTWDSDQFFRRKMNQALQKIGPVEIGKKGKKSYRPMFPTLTTYYARHSWASIAASLDIPIETISAGLGHEYGNKVTAVYINFDNRKVDIANRKVIDWVLYGKIDDKVVVKPGTPEFFGLEPDEAVALGLCEAKKRGRKPKIDMNRLAESHL